MKLRRVLPSLVMTTILVVAAAVSLGMPDWKLASQYLFGNFPTEQAALAVAVLVCWSVIVMVAITSIALSVTAATEAQMVHRRWARATMFVAAGAVLLGVGTLHHSGTGYSMCCGTQAQHVAEAQQLAESR